MIKLYFAPRTRSVRILWLLEELGLPYELKRIEFERTSDRFFVQKTPTGKLPTLEDGDVLMCESGAIVEYILERHGGGRLAPPIDSADRAMFLQWVHFAESTAFPPLGIVAWLTRYRGEGDQYEELLADARSRAAHGFEYLEDSLGENQFILGADFSAADIMLGFSLVAGRILGVLDDRFPKLCEYTARLKARPALARSLAR